MKVIIENLNYAQTIAIVKSLTYHFSNEGINVISPIRPAKMYSERSPDLMPKDMQVTISEF